MNQETYRVYEIYSTSYIIDITKLNTALVEAPTKIDDWVSENCYHIIASHLTDDFLGKLTHNIQLAQKTEDVTYIAHICKKLKIEVDLKEWKYIPTKLKIKLKTPMVSDGFTPPDRLINLLQIPIGTVLKHRAEMVHWVHKYIYDHQLQNRYDRTVITPDEMLTQLLTPLSVNEMEYTYFNLSAHLILT